MSTKRIITTVLIAILGLLIVTAVGYGQQAEPETPVDQIITAEYPPGGGDLLIRGVEGRYLIVTDIELHRKMDLLLERVAAIEVALLPAIETPAEPSPTLPAPAINLNSATFDELLTIPGIGKVKAGALIAERGASGEFVDWADLMRRVKGIGPATTAEMQMGGAVVE